MPFEKGNKLGVGGAHGGATGRPPRINPIYLEKFQHAMHKRMLPLAKKILLRMLRDRKHPEHQKWAVERVLKKAVPDAFTFDAANANSLADTLNRAFKDKTTPMDEKELEQDDTEEKDSFTRKRPGRTKLNEQRRKDGTLPENRPRKKIPGDGTEGRG